jgi:hypothetical protein
VYIWRVILLITCIFGGFYYECKYLGHIVMYGEFWAFMYIYMESCITFAHEAVRQGHPAALLLRLRVGSGPPRALDVLSDVLEIAC